MSAVVSPAVDTVRLDLGAGINKKEGFIGVDLLPLTGVDLVHDLRKAPWPWEDNSVDEIHSSHFLEHLTNLNDKWERVTFFNECYRILKKDAKLTLVIPHWASCRYYGDPSHKEAFSEFAFYYLDPNWRKVNAPHACAENNPVGGYSCDFNAVWGYSWNPALNGRNQEYVQFAASNYKEAIYDVHATLTKR